MSIKRIKDLPEGSGSLSNDDIFLFMDDPAGSSVTKKISLSQISAAIGGGGGGNADTGDVSFSGVQIIGTGTLELVPNSDLYNNDQYLIVDPTAPNHIHLRAGGNIDSSNAELIVGGENSNVRIGVGSNPEITIKTAGSNTVEFLGQIDNGFGDGPGATLHVTSIINGTITDGMTIYGEGLPAEGWVLQFGTVMAPQGDGGIGNYYLSGANYLIGSQLFNNSNSTNNIWTFANDGNLSIPGNILLDNGTSVAEGTFDNGTGGNNGVSLNCAVGYELNWQGGHLRSSEIGNSSTAHPLFVDSPIRFPGTGIAYMAIDASGITFSDGTIQTTAASGNGGGSSSITVVDLGSVSGNIVTPANSGEIFDLMLMSSGTLADPSGGVDGQTLRWRITYNNNNIPLSLGSGFRIPNSATNPLPISTSSGLTDLLGATYDSSRNKWDIIAFVPGY